jgi:hypothetical protein
MRLVFRIDSSPIPLLHASLAVCVAFTLGALPGAVSAQESVAAQAAASTEAAVVSAQQSVDTATDETSSAATADAASGNDAAGEQVLNVPAESAAMSDVALDDQVLSRQRGGAAGMVMVATTPQLTHGNGVTLWDEIAPPSPLPIPIDAARAAQGNVANYQRK